MWRAEIGGLVFDDATRTVIDERVEPPVTVRAYSALEMAEADARAARAAADVSKAEVRGALRVGAAGDLSKLRTSIDDLAALLAASTSPGSIREILGEVGDPAGTTTLRALRAQTNTAVTNAASIKAFIGLVISLGQAEIDLALATRKMARQVLRVASLVLEEYSSSDVGSE